MQTKHNMKMATLSLAVGLVLWASNGLQAASSETTKGPEQTERQGSLLTTKHDFRSLKKGDKVEVFCPMMKTTEVTTISDVDTKGHAKVEETKQGWKVSGCNIILQRKPGSKESSTVMVCPDGTLTPVHCKKV